MKGGEAMHRASLRRAGGCMGLGQKQPVWESSGQLVAGVIVLWRGGNAVSVAVKPLSSAGKSSAIPSPGRGERLREGKGKGQERRQRCT